MLVVAAVLGVFVFTTRPTVSDSGIPTTQPAPIAALDVDQLDIQTVATNDVTHDWVSERLGEPGQINDILRFGSTFVAVGATPEGAHVWLSSTGGNWRDVARFEVPEAPKTSIDHAVNWDGGIVALGSAGDGVGLWTASYSSNWTYQGRIAAFDANRIQDLAAGPELLAVAAPEGHLLGWMSVDGIDWRALGRITDLDGALVHGIAATADRYFAFGEGDCATPCAALIYRSEDGINWEVVADGLGADSRGVTGIAETPQGLLATGWVDGPNGVTTALWESNDGEAWNRIAVEEPVFRPASVRVQLLSTNPGGNPIAEIVAGRTTIEVTIGTEITTDVGVLTVSNIDDSSIALILGSNTRPIDVLDTTVITATAIPTHISVEGSRIVLAGYMSTGQSGRPLVWVSDDSGTTWTRLILESDGGAVSTAATAGPHIVAIGSAAEQALTWRAAWDTDSTRAKAVDVVTAYLDALNTRDDEDLLGLLPKSDEGAIPPEFMVPSLGGTVHPWWNEETGHLDPNRVGATLDYLQATAASFTVGECASVASLGSVDRVNVRCEYTVDSALLSMFGIEGGIGHLDALVRSGVLTTVTLDSSPSANMWQVLASWMTGAETRDPSAPLDGDIATIEFDRSSAADHQAEAERLLAGVLAPGATTTVETPLGTMEWKWLTGPQFGSAYLRSITWSDLGFIAAGYSGPSSQPPSFSAWISPDGEAWRQLDTPDTWDGLADIQPFHEGVIATVYSQSTVKLAYYDGNDWTMIPIAEPDEASYLDVARVAVSEDRVMVISGWWREDGFLLNEAAIMGTDLIPHTVALPPEDSWAETNIQLAGSDEGFVLGISSWFQSNPGLSIWYTADGLDWTIPADSAALGDAQFVWNLQRHRSQYFVVGESTELRCTTSAAGENCVSLIQLWSSPDGVAWDRVITETGEPVSTYEIGSGPLGLVAFSQELEDSTFPRLVYFSTDATSWASAGDLTLLNPDAEWWYIDTPAVGIDTVVAVGSSFNATNSQDQNDEPFLIIGRLLDD
jgi:hypothetical protein